MNWKEEAREKLQRYEAMRLATVNIPLELQRLEQDIRSIRGVKLDGNPGSGSLRRREDALLNNMIQRQELSLALERAKSWLNITDRALTALDDSERQILHQLYIFPRKGGVDQLCKELGLESSSIYRRRDKALRQFTIALYGTADS